MMTLGMFTVINANAQTRYIDEIFTNVSRQNNVVYDSNIAVNLLFGTPGLPPSLNGSPLWMENLVCDIYSPAGDAQTNRPVIILAHTGSYLPAILNNQVTGNKNDSTIVTVATNFAKRGYVVVAPNYRLGWNPTTTNQEQATEQLLKATYRGIQDMRNCIRFLRSNASTFGIDTSKIIVGGQGTGGYISLALGSVDKREEIEGSLKFLRGDASPMVNVDTLGDWMGLGGITIFNLPKNPNISAKAHMTFNYGGAMGDTSWIDNNTLPHVSLHCVGDIFAPFLTGNVVVPTTGVTVIPNASGGGHVIPSLNRRGINNKINRMMPSDMVSMMAMRYTNGVNNLFPIRTAFPAEGAPWEFWNRTAVQGITSAPYRGIPLPANGRAADSISMITNPFMSEPRGRAYCDTIARFIAPRIALQFNLAANKELDEFNLLSPAQDQNIDIYNDATKFAVIKWEKSMDAASSPINYTFAIDFPDGNFINPIVALNAGNNDSIAIPMNIAYGLLTDLGFGDDQTAIADWAVFADNGTFTRRSSSVRWVRLTKRASVGIAQENNISSFVNVYPNPAKESLNISMEKGKAAIAGIQIMDITGRRILNLEGLNTHQQQIMLSSFGAGVYFANITNTNGATTSKRFVVE